MKNVQSLLGLIFIMLLTGCSAAEASNAKLEPLANWPTAQPTAAAASPTPFPKISLSDVATATPLPATATPVEVAAVVTATVIVSPTAHPVATATTASNNHAIASMPAVVTAKVNIAAANLRQGPGPDYARVGAVTEGKQVEVLAVNPHGDWALVRSANPGVGWVLLDYLTPAGALTNAPKLQTVIGEPASTVADKAAAAAAVTVANPQPTANQPADYAALVAITTAKPAVVKPGVRPGPATTFAPIDELADPQESLTILGLDASRQWALVQPQHSRVGWVSLSEVQPAGSVEAAPTIYSAWVTANEVALYSGPGIFNGQVGLLAINNIVRVIGLNDGRSWALVQPVLGGSTGWAQLLNLTLSNDIMSLPLAPAPKVVAVPTVSPVAAAASAKQGKLVFQTSSGGDIMVMNADGSGLRRLTAGIDPALSPDGKMVAFTRWPQGESAPGSLWVIGIDGSNERQIMEFVKQPKGAEWSPDGSKIAINFQHEGRTEEKQVKVEYSEKHVDQIPWNASGAKVDIKPIIKNGHVVGGVPYLQYTLPPDPHWGLRVVNVADGKFEDVDGGTYAFRPAWDPTQAWRLVSDGGRGLVEVDVNRNVNRPITDNLSDGSPAFSPDGRYLAVSAGKSNGGSGFDIYRLNRDGTGRVQLTKTPLFAPLVPGGDNKQWNNVSPAWSPDGAQIAFLTDRTGRWEFWVMNADGSNQRAMFPDEVNAALNIQYNFVDEKVFSWR